MSRIGGLAGALLVLGAAAGFAALNGGQRVTVNLGFVRFFRVPVVFVAFGGLLVGMIAMFLAGIYTDLRVREILRERLREEDREERAFVDRSQTDLFGGDRED